MNNKEEKNNNLPSSSNKEVEFEIENLELDGDIKLDLTPDSNTSIKNDVSSSASNDLQDVSNDDETNNEPENVNDANNVPESSNDTSDISDSIGENKEDIGENLPSEQSNDSNGTFTEENARPKEDNLPAENDKDEKKDVSNEENSDKNQKEDTGKQNDSDDGKKDLKSDNEGLDKKDNNALDKKDDNLPDKKENDDPNKNKPSENNPSKQGDKPSPKGSDGAKTPEPKAPSKPSNSGGGSFKDRLRNGAKNAAERAKQRAGNAASDKVNNSKPMQAYNKARNAAQKAKNTADKAKKGLEAAKKTAKVAGKAAKGAAKAASGLAKLIASTFPWSLIVIAVLILVIVLIIVIAGDPGQNNVNKTEEEANYSEVDLKTLEKLKTLYSKYSSSDAALSMVTVVYPYYEILYNSEVMDYIEKGGGNVSDSDVFSDIEDYEDKDEAEDEEDNCEEGDEKCEADRKDDRYLEKFRKWKYRRKFKKLLKKSNSMTEDEFKEYIINDYMESESGYKELLAYVSSNKRDEFKEMIYENLVDQKEYFKSYIYDNVVCSSSSQSVSYSDAGGILEGEGVVVLKDTLSTNFTEMKNAKTLYGTENLNLTIKRYVMGVAYNEISSEVKNEAVAKSVMVASQSFLLGRTSPGSADGVGMGYKTEKKDGKTIFYMRANSYDQGFCDVYEGCDKNAGIYSHTNVEGTPNSSGLILPKEVSVIGYPKLDAASLSNLEKWYDEISGEFVYDDKTKGFAGNQFDTWGSYCPQGRCLAHQEVIKLAHSGRDYKNILYGSMYSDSRYAAYSMETKMLSSETSTCDAVNTEGECAIPSKEFKYYSQKVGEFSGIQFCGRSGATIRSSGCGTTSMSMILANLYDQNITPKTTMEEAHKLGYCGSGIDGTASGYFGKAATSRGLTYKAGTKGSTDTSKGASDIENTLRAGGMVIVNVNGSWLGGGSGHYIAVKGIRKDNTLIFADPYADSATSNKNATTDVNAKRLLDNYVNPGHGWFMFTSGKSADIVKQYCSTLQGDGKSSGKLDYPISGMSKPSCSDYPNYSSGSYHGGTDISVPVGTNVLAMDGGTVTTSKDLVGCDGRYCGGGYRSYGRYIEITHSNGMKTKYAHLSERKVKEGDKVSKGQLIGLSGSTGNSSGPHLHIEVIINGSNQSPCKYLN